MRTDFEESCDDIHKFRCVGVDIFREKFARVDLYGLGLDYGVSRFLRGVCLCASLREHPPLLHGLRWNAKFYREQV